LTFGSPGEVTTTFGTKSDDVAQALALQPGGRIVAVGYRSAGEESEFALARYTAEGSLDSSFGTGVPNGSLDTSFGSSDKRCIVPNVKGEKLEAARGAIKRRDCEFGPIGKSFSRTVKKGYVIGQFPRGGTPCLAGQKVVLSVSKGKRKGR